MEDINPKIKRLYSSLLKLNFEQFLITRQFEHVCLDLNIDQIWERKLEYVRSLSSVSILVPGYTGYAKEALHLFLMELVNRDDFLKIMDELLQALSSLSTTPVNLSEVMERLVELKFDEREINSMKVFQPKVKITDFKISRVFSKKTTSIEKMCFVLMPFDERFNSIYTDLIKPVVSETGYDCKRADEIFSTKPIIEDIWEHIQKAKFLIADLTSRNPNVFYELGMAHAINKEVILITQNSNDVPFDLKHYRYIIYEDSVAGASKLGEGIKNTIKSVIS